MNKTNTLSFVLTLATLVPPIAWAQAAPPAADAAVTGASKAAGARRAAAAPTRRPLALATDAPSSHTVVKGDTLWDISAKFLKEPYRWPEIWNMNRAQVSDPHWIYPGDVIALTVDANGNPSLSVVSSAGAGDIVKLSPKVRASSLSEAIPSIPSRVINPYLTQPLVTEEGALLGAPRIVATEDDRVIVGAGNRAYAAGLKTDQGVKWQIYRPGKALTDPVTAEVLGHEAVYLGDAKVTRFGENIGESSTLEVVKSNFEIARGDRLTATTDASVPSYSPRSPDKQVRGSIVALPGNVSEGVQYSVVVVGLGKRDGIQVGHVLGASRKGKMVSTDDRTSSSASTDSVVTQFFKGVGDNFDKLMKFNEDYEAEKAGKKIKKVEEMPGEIKIPEERIGLVFVFRTFEKVSYALVTSSSRPILVGDIIQTP